MEKEKFDAYIELAKFRRARWETRNNLEWRIAFSLWALLAATVYYLKGAQFPIWFALLAWAGHAYLLFQIRMRNHEDNWLSFNYLLEAEKLLTSDPKTRLFGQQVIGGTGALVWFWLDYSPLIQLSVTAGLLALSYLGLQF